MSQRRINHPGQPTRLIDEGPASVSLTPFAAIGALSASAIRETVPGPTGGAGPVVRVNGHTATGPLSDLTSASAAAEEAWKRKQAADAAWDIARAAVARAFDAVAGIIVAVPSPAEEPGPPVVKPSQADRDQQSRRNGQASMQVAKKRKPMSVEARENMRQAALRRFARQKAEAEAASA